MVPQVATVEELKRIHSYVQRIHKVVELTHGINVKFKFGTMIEVVRACVRAGRMAETAEFFSFGTNDLTQATFSFSREDAENKFLPAYTETGILQDNPFEVLDIKGVGQLMKMAVAKGRETRPDLKVGICGEHGGNPVLDPLLPSHRHHVRLVLRPARAGGAAGGGPGQAPRARAPRLGLTSCCNDRSPARSSVLVGGAGFEPATPAV